MSPDPKGETLPCCHSKKPHHDACCLLVIVLLLASTGWAESPTGTPEQPASLTRSWPLRIVRGDPAEKQHAAPGVEVFDLVSPTRPVTRDAPARRA